MLGYCTQMEFLDLVHAYIATSTIALARLKLELGNDFSDAKSPKGYPHQLADGSEYQFHGIGCRFTETSGIEVDFDFTPSGGANGFDAWRLWQFAKQLPVEYSNFQTLNSVETALKDAIAKHLVHRSKIGSDKLFYLT